MHIYGDIPNYCKSIISSLDILIIALPDFLPRKLDEISFWSIEWKFYYIRSLRETCNRLWIRQLLSKNIWGTLVWKN